MKKGILAIAAILAAHMPAANGATHDTFSGACNVVLTSVGSYTSTEFSFTGTGTCDGTLNGQQIEDTVDVRGHGDAHYFVEPLIANGFATVTLGTDGPRFPLGFDQSLALIHVFGLCDGCGGDGMGVAQPLTEQQPADQMQPTQVYRLVLLAQIHN